MKLLLRHTGIAGVGLVAFLSPMMVQAASVTNIVARVLWDGEPRAAAAGVSVEFGSNTTSGIKVGESLADGTRIVTPPHVTIDIKRSDGKADVLVYPGTYITLVTTSSSGQDIRQDGGSTVFSIVVHALDFYRVTFRKFTASAHGTVFSLHATKSHVTFTCTRGEVNVTKTGYVLIGARRLKASLIDVISAAKRRQVSYPTSSRWYLTTFANFAQAEAFYRQRLAAAKTTGDANAVAAALNNIGNVEEYQGQFPEALQAHQKALTLFQKLGDRDGEAGALDKIGNVDEEESEYPEGLLSHEQALALFKQLGDLDGEARALDNIGNVHQEQKEYSEALRSYQAALAIFEQLGDRDGEASVMGNIGVVKHHEGQDPEALLSLQQALALLEQLGDVDGEARTLDNIGNVEDDQERYPEALQSHQQALALFQQLGDRDGAARALENIGGVEKDQNRYADALQSYEQALAMFQQLGEPSHVVTVRVNIGKLQALIESTATPPPQPRASPP